MLATTVIGCSLFKNQSKFKYCDKSHIIQKYCKSKVILMFICVAISNHHVSMPLKTHSNRRMYVCIYICVYVCNMYVCIMNILKEYVHLLVIPIIVVYKAGLVTINGFNTHTSNS